MYNIFIVSVGVELSLIYHVNRRDYYAERSLVGSGYECESCSRNHFMIKSIIVKLNLGPPFHLSSV